MIESSSPETTNRSASPRSTTESESPAALSSDNDSEHFRSISDVERRAEHAASAITESGKWEATTTAQQRQPTLSQPLTSLHIRTDIPAIGTDEMDQESDIYLHQNLSSGSLLHRTPSFRAIMASATSSNGSLSPASLISSPQLAALGDITPLPSPIQHLSSPWKRQDPQILPRPSSQGSISNLRQNDSTTIRSPSASQSRIKQYRAMDKLGEKSPESPNGTASRIHVRHERNRSLSEYVPVGRGGAPRRSGPSLGITTSTSTDSKSTTLHRERHLAVQRGIKIPTVRPPSPPRSSRGDDSKGEGDGLFSGPAISTEAAGEIYSVRSIRTQLPRKYRSLRQLGQGAFSQVSLAVRIETEDGTPTIHGSEPVLADDSVQPSQRLVAVKIIEYGPAGGADEERLDVSLKREVEILKSVNHPSLVQLKAFGSVEKRALLVLDYCPGGDLFDFAASGHKPMSSHLVRRIFAELVDAVRYLHSHYIVHRDIKLENVLVNMPAAAMEKINYWRTHDRAVITLSDLGLSRRIPEPPESPLLTTRCGSEDYAAPEILMGQPYDGRATDAWALGVLLYAMMENRLPFDVLPGTRGDPAKLRARTGHRIARLEWSWYRFADGDGEWDPTKGEDFEGARLCVEALLKRNTRRKNLDEIASISWVQEAIDVPLGLKRADKEVP